MTDQPAATITAAEIAHSQQRWRHQRDYLNQHRHDLTLALDHLYPADCRVAGTLLMARPEWCPARPVPLAAVALAWRPGPGDPPVDPVQPIGSERVRPLRDDGTRFGSYAEALAALRPPRLLANRTCYRLLAATANAAATDADADDTTGNGARLTFGVGQYFDLINVSEAVA